jgi:enoyl-CoA hydratase/carnithine racemase
VRQAITVESFPSRVDFVLDVPATHNALSSGLVSELQNALKAAAATPEVRVVSIRSAGSVFCSGFDLAEELPDDAVAVERFSAIQEMLELLVTAPHVTVAFVDGAAYGAGADLVAACDYRIGTERARFSFPGSRFGVVLGLQRLTSCIGGDQARDIVLRRSVVGSDEAVAIGLLTGRGERDEWVPYAAQLAADVADLDRTTLAAILAVTRGADRSEDGPLLARSLKRPGLAGRIAAYAAR